MRPDFLFAAPSWLSGVGRTLDLSGQFDTYNDSPTETRADAIALFADWRLVGESLMSAIGTVIAPHERPSEEEAAP